MLAQFRCLFWGALQFGVDFGAKMLLAVGCLDILESGLGWVWGSLRLKLSVCGTAYVNAFCFKEAHVLHQHNICIPKTGSNLAQNTKTNLGVFLWFFGALIIPKWLIKAPWTYSNTFWISFGTSKKSPNIVWNLYVYTSQHFWTFWKCWTLTDINNLKTSFSFLLCFAKLVGRKQSSSPSVFRKEKRNFTMVESW